jgi:hypothetical protein
MEICEKIRITWKDQPFIASDGVRKDRCLVVKELEVAPDTYKPLRFGPVLPMSAHQAELLLHSWVRYPLISNEA